MLFTAISQTIHRPTWQHAMVQAAEGQVSPASISERRSAKGTSPIKQLRERMSKSQPRINFDDATFAGKTLAACTPVNSHTCCGGARQLSWLLHQQTSLYSHAS